MAPTRLRAFATVRGRAHARRTTVRRRIRRAFPLPRTTNVTRARARLRLASVRRADCDSLTRALPVRPPRTWKPPRPRASRPAARRSAIVATPSHTVATTGHVTGSGITEPPFSAGGTAQVPTNGGAAIGAPAPV